MKPKKLNLQEITKIYYLLKPSLEGLGDKFTVGEGIQMILDNALPTSLLECINIMYDNNIEFDSYNEFVLLFIEAISKNDFFEFVLIMKELTDGISTR